MLWVPRMLTDYVAEKVFISWDMSSKIKVPRDAKVTLLRYVAHVVKISASYTTTYIKILMITI